MKCSASQTISSVNNSTLLQSKPPALDDARLHEVATQFESILVGFLMRPMAKAMGPMSGVISQQLSVKIAAGMSEPLYEQLRSQMQIG